MWSGQKTHSEGRVQHLCLLPSSSLVTALSSPSSLCPNVISLSPSLILLFKTITTCTPFPSPYSIFITALITKCFSFTFVYILSFHINGVRARIYVVVIAPVPKIVSMQGMSWKPSQRDSSRGRPMNCVTWAVRWHEDRELTGAISNELCEKISDWCG